MVRRRPSDGPGPGVLLSHLFIERQERKKEKEKKKSILFYLALCTIGPLNWIIKIVYSACHCHLAVCAKN